MIIFSQINTELTITRYQHPKGGKEGNFDVLEESSSRQAIQVTTPSAWERGGRKNEEGCGCGWIGKKQTKRKPMKKSERYIEVKGVGRDDKELC
jgi:hypothetical protein